MSAGFSAAVRALEPRELFASLPAWAVWGQRRGAVLAQPRDPDGQFTKGPNGRLLCCWCHVEVPKRRQCWCSNDHAARGYLVGSWKTLRLVVIERDGDRCRACMADHPGWIRYDAAKPPQSVRMELHARHYEAERSVPYFSPTGSGRIENRVVPYSVLLEAPWEVDHVVPVALGGTDDPDNLETACSACHKRKSGGEAKLIAKSRRIRAANAVGKTSRESVRW